MTEPSTEPSGEARFVYMTAGLPEEARAIGRVLVTERLAACANLVPGLTSIYRWQGAIQHDSEWLLIIKTRGTVYPLLEARIRELHSYNTPEIIALPIQTGSAAYLDWIAGNTGAPL